MKKHQVRKIANLMFLYIGIVNNHILPVEKPLAFRGRTAKPPCGKLRICSYKLVPGSWRLVFSKESHGFRHKIYVSKKQQPNLTGFIH